jgi:hypothetical protein
MVDAKAAPDYASQSKSREERKDTEILLIGRNTAGASSIEQNNSYAGKPSQDRQNCAHQAGDEDGKSIAILFGAGWGLPSRRWISIPIIAVISIVRVLRWHSQMGHAGVRIGVALIWRLWVSARR